MESAAALASFLAPYLDWPFAISAAVAIFAAALRAFTGFGANVVWAPILIHYYGPVEMVAITAIVAVVTAPQLMIPASRDADWRVMWIMGAAVAVAAPLGVVTLLHVDPLVVKKAFGAFVLVCSLVLASGWVYRGTHSPLATAATGGLAGWIAGFAAVGGPIFVLYFLSAPGDVKVQRANNTISVSLLAPITLIALVWNDAVTQDALIRSILLLGPVAFGQWIGARLFRVAPIMLFKRVSLGLMMAIGVTVLVF